MSLGMGRLAGASGRPIPSVSPSRRNHFTPCCLLRSCRSDVHTPDFGRRRIDQDILGPYRPPYCRTGAPPTSGTQWWRAQRPPSLARPVPKTGSPSNSGTKEKPRQASYKHQASPIAFGQAWTKRLGVRRRSMCTRERRQEELPHARRWRRSGWRD